MSRKLRFGLVGCGSFGRVFSDYVLEVADIVALCDADLQRAESLGREHGLQVPCYADYRRMLVRGGLDCLALTVSNDLHAPITIAAAEAGVHVFCEKAMARTVPECWEMVRACRSKGVKLMIGHKRRLRPPWERMIELSGEAYLGAPLAITVAGYCDFRAREFFNTWWGDPERSGGFFHQTGVHVIDWFRAMCGDAISVSAMRGPQQDERYGFPDVVHATFRFRSGAVASISGSLAYPLHQFRESEGPWGQCRNGGFMLVPELDHIDLYWQRLAEDRRHHERFDDLGFDAAYRREIGDFVRWVQEDRTPCLSWVEGLRCVEMMEAAYRSIEADGAPVRLPLYPDLEDRSAQ